MANFDFITNNELRVSLQTDDAELDACMKAKAWKAVHVLAGSIIEAVLTDTLLVSDHQATGGKDPLTMDLGQVILACKNKRYLTQRTEDLCTVIRNYRNLIHPGRMVRDEEQVSEESATVAMSLVKMIVQDVASERNKTYGYTAKEIVDKLRYDKYAIGILPHLLKKTNALEVENLLLQSIPEVYQELTMWSDDETMEASAISSLQKGFREAFDNAPAELKVKVTLKFAKLVEEGRDRELSAYTKAFFRASDMQYLLGNERLTVKSHLLIRIKEDLDEALLSVIKGFSDFLDVKDIVKFIDPLVKGFVYNTNNKITQSIYDYFSDECESMKPELQVKVFKRLQVWLEHFNKDKKMLYSDDVDLLIQALYSANPFVDE